MDFEARSRILSYLLGEADLADLEEWLTVATWDVEAATADTEVALDAVLLLAEHARGHRTDDELASSLRRLVMTAHLGEQREILTASSSETERATGWPRIVAAGTQLAPAHG